MHFCLPFNCKSKWDLKVLWHTGNCRKALDGMRNTDPRRHKTCFQLYIVEQQLLMNHGCLWLNKEHSVELFIWPMTIYHLFVIAAYVFCSIMRYTYWRYNLPIFTRAGWNSTERRKGLLEKTINWLIPNRIFFFFFLVRVYSICF